MSLKVEKFDEKKNSSESDSNNDLINVTFLRMSLLFI